MDQTDTKSATGRIRAVRARHRFRSAFALAALVAVLGLLVPASTAAAQSRLEYAGTATTTVQLVNVYGQVAGVPTYTTNVRAFVGPANPQETNPFALVMQSNPVVNAPGEWGFWSSSLADDVTLQYWNFERQTDGAVRGQLVNNQAPAAAALNLLTVPAEIAPNIPMPMSYAMANGTTITGTFTDTRLTFTIEGNTTDMAHPFRIEGVLDRVN